jgi:DNA replication protein DnaC
MASEERDQLLANLRRLQLRHAAHQIDELLREAAQLKLGHLGFLARVVEAEVLARTETTTHRRIQEAHFPQPWRIEDYDFKEQPCLDRKVILDLAELGFLDRCESLFFLGPSGVGKTHLSVGLGMRACAAGYRVRYVRTYDLLKDLLAAMADDTFEDRLEEHCRPDLLILDEVGNHPGPPGLAERNFAGVFYEVVHQRYRHGSAILASNLGVNDWAAALGGPPGLVATALDRLLEGAHILTFPPEAESHRAKCERGPGPLPNPRPRRRHRAPAPRPPGGGKKTR